MRKSDRRLSAVVSACAVGDDEKNVSDELVDEALRMTGQNQVAASQLLGVNRTTLRNKMTRD